MDTDILSVYLYSSVYSWCTVVVYSIEFSAVTSSGLLTYNDYFAASFNIIGKTVTVIYRTFVTHFDYLLLSFLLLLLAVYQIPKYYTPIKFTDKILNSHDF